MWEGYRLVDEIEFIPAHPLLPNRARGTYIVFAESDYAAQVTCRFHLSMLVRAAGFMREEQVPWEE